MLDNKKLNMIISLIIAIALWAFVIGEVNPQASRVYRDVPITLINEEVLTENDLAVFSVSDTSLSVTLTGTRSEINQVDPKEITATVDLDQAAMGENLLRIEVKVPGKVEVEDQSLNKVTLVVEEKIAKVVDIHVRYNGDFDGEEEPITVDKNLDQVTVTGAKSNVNRVANVDAVVEDGKVTGQTDSFDCNLIPVDANGLQVMNVELDVDSISVTAELARLKTVPLEVDLLEEESENIQRTVKVPETITLKGRMTDLEEIESISTQRIDLNDVMENRTIPLTPILPEHVEVSEDSEPLTAVVEITRLATKTITFDQNDVVMNHLPESLSASVKDEVIEITVKGNSDTIDLVGPADFTLSVDLRDLSVGERKVNLDVRSTVESISIIKKPTQVTVDAKASQEAGEGNHETKQSDAEDSIGE